jgi:hypothetical protein
MKKTKRQEWFEAQFGQVPPMSLTLKLKEEIEELEKVLALKRRTFEKHRLMNEMFKAHMYTHMAKEKGYSF